MKTLETYLKENHERNAIDHALRADVAADGTVSFYVHPLGVDGDTLDFVVAGNQLIPKYVVDDMKVAAEMNPIPPEIRAKMDADRARAEREAAGAP